MSSHRIPNGTLPLLMALLMVLATPVLAENGHEHGAHDHARTEKPTSSRVPYDIHFKTHPEPAEVIPDRDTVELMFNVTRDGEPARNVEFSYRVYAPPKTFWFGTDFPVVEGTQLLSGTVALPTGEQVISMILPIRGDYRVKTTVRGNEGVRRKTFRFSVSENPREILNLSIFLGILFLVGGIGGYFLSGGRSAGTPAGWILLLGVTTLGAGLSPSAVYAHGQGRWDPHTLERQLGPQTLGPGVQLSVKAFPQPVDVGEMLAVRYSVKVPGDRKNHGHEHTTHGESEANHHEEGHEHGHADPDSVDFGDFVLAESHFVHSEGGLEMVTQSSWLKHGEGSINVQLFDGAPHYLVTRFYKPTERYAPARGHEHGHGDESSADDSKGKQHDHGEKTGKPPWEAETHYDLAAGTHQVQFGPSGDPAMQWLLQPGGVDHPGETARHAMEECESVEPGGIMNEPSTCYNLTLNDDGTMFEFQVPEDGTYRLFTQHLPREFDMTVRRGGSVVDPRRKFIPGKGEYLGRQVEWVEVNGIHPPLDDIVKSMLTLLGVVGLGFFVGYRRPGFSG